MEVSDHTRKQPKNPCDFGLCIILLVVQYIFPLLIQIIIRHVCSCPTVRRLKADGGRTTLGKIKACDPCDPH